MDEINNAKIRRLKNLRPYKDMTDEEIVTTYTEKRRLDTLKGIPIAKPDKSDNPDYERRFNEKLELFKAEYAVDMNDSNDAMLLVLLVRHSIQLEDIDGYIRKEMKNPELDSRNLKNLGDVQRSLITSIGELQTSLGISRKARKEHQTDDIPKWIADTRKKALDFWQRKTIPVVCEDCKIELARFWLNFAESATKVEMELECWQCKTKVMYKY